MNRYGKQYGKDRAGNPAPPKKRPKPSGESDEEEMDPDVFEEESPDFTDMDVDQGEADEDCMSQEMVRRTLPYTFMFKKPRFCALQEESKSSSWARKPLERDLNPTEEALIFQQIEIDHYIGQIFLAWSFAKSACISYNLQGALCPACPAHAADPSPPSGCTAAPRRWEQQPTTCPTFRGTSSLP